MEYAMPRNAMLTYIPHLGGGVSVIFSCRSFTIRMYRVIYIRKVEKLFNESRWNKPDILCSTLPASP